MANSCCCLGCSLGCSLDCSLDCSLGCTIPWFCLALLDSWIGFVLNTAQSSSSSSLDRCALTVFSFAVTGAHSWRCCRSNSNHLAQCTLASLLVLLLSCNLVHSHGSFVVLIGNTCRNSFLFSCLFSTWNTLNGPLFAAGLFTDEVFVPSHVSFVNVHSRLIGNTCRNLFHSETTLNEPEFFSLTPLSIESTVLLGPNEPTLTSFPSAHSQHLHRLALETSNVLLPSSITSHHQTSRALCDPSFVNRSPSISWLSVTRGLVHGGSTCCQFSAEIVIPGIISIKCWWKRPACDATVQFNRNYEHCCSAASYGCRSF